MSWLRTPLARRSKGARRRRRAFPLLPSARPTGDCLVLLPMKHGHRRHRTKRVWTRAAWIAGAVLMVGLAAIALDEARWVETLMEGSDPAVEPEAGPDPFGLGNLGLPPPDGTPPPDEPPPPP